MTTVDETKKVWEEHIQAWDARDLDAIMVHYTEDSIMILNSTVKRGIEEIRNVFDNLFKLFDSGDNTIAPVVIEGEVV
ncbi:MAG: nuclear transport factor 2 family protein [Okeania sp. SIO2C2]|uniref:nuclear transport factor 2 family protein n=1 Tax=Okeania sp. SIO2C2 TaxID=2607787 RepID=UPI0013B704DE|nr:nuclear transport factor 2 family protein [Okeania sp. SIO2C2]NEP87351.1 nuclear transport factor 2 family protein [Okeania sp. SIO2C2]